MEKVVYFILQHLRIGGIEICVTDVANALAKRGYQVVLLTLLSDNELKERISPLIKIEHLTSLRWGGDVSVFYKLKRMVLTKRVLCKKLKSIRNSVIVSTQNDYSVLVSKVVSSDCLKIAQLHHEYLDRRGMVNDFRNNYSRIDYFFALTDDVCSEVAAIMKAKNSHTMCVTIPNFLPKQEFLIRENEERENVALAVGRLAPEKGFLRLLDAWKIVDERSDGKYRLYIVGEGIEYKNIIDKIQNLHLQNSVSLLGLLPPSEVKKWMGRAKVYCMSSFTEAFSLVLVEAMGNGLPQVAFDVRVGPRNLIVENQTGYLIKDGDLDTYASRIYTLLTEDEQWSKMSKASVVHSAKFSEDVVMKKWEEILKGTWNK